MSEVAQLADVSPSTVSLYLRRPDEVSTRRGERIQSAIDKLGYLPNTMAGGLASSRSNIIGVIVPTITFSFFSETLETLEKSLRAAGYQLLIGNTEFDASREEELIRSILSWNPSGLVLTGFSHSRKSVSLLTKSDISIVEMWDYGQEGLDMVVGFSHRTCGRLVAEHLIRNGYQNMAFLSTNFHRDIRANERYLGFRDAVVASGGSVELRELVGRSNTAEAGKLLRILINEHPETQALFCSNDMVALGAMLECQRQGWSIPERLAIVGFGNQDFTGSTLPPMTTVEPPRQEIGNHTARLLLTRLRGNDSTNTETRIDLGVRLIVRESS
ncbi:MULTISPECIES: LacI family DNA-binding transcriptional regulator [Halomonas]|uniref:LacI family DNA-binding transcriptional regulator n=1 Tax=Halomonas casei TaxID=2742613 RepID=A0ABR9EXD3_9GAMM|nr:LacI family DNA-binding transcriptional regulator [Halomonas casei]MBE0398754.1 LacI family DNA-binding transcriptional regulator [Halomonas casei]